MIDQTSARARLAPLLCLGAALLFLSGCRTPCAGPAARYDFALIGDLPYNEQQSTHEFPNLIEELNRERLAFVVHDGDIKAGSSPCTDERFQACLRQFQSIRHPLIYTFGDNEWTDCDRVKYDPLERLQKLRELFAQGDHSLGQRPLKLTRQSGDPAHPAFRENTRWSSGPVTFACLNVPGPANNFTKPEFVARNAANIAWLRAAFDSARRADHRALMLIMQANPFPERGGTNKTLPGFREMLKVLEEETLAFARPVVLVHGDSHHFRIDKPLLGIQSKRRLENFTRVETFGDPDVHWLRVTVDERDPQVFTFRQRIVDRNRVDHRRPAGTGVPKP